jgi:membrane-bound lytic murein transglycosylase MltF
MTRPTLLTAITLTAIIGTACGQSAPSTGAAPPQSSPPPQTAAAPSQSPAPAQPATAPADNVADDDPGAGTPDEATMLTAWNGDLDGMIERRYIRVLCTFNRTNYFLDKAEQRGVTYEAGRLFEAFLNKQLGMKTVKIHVAFIPVRRDQLFPLLAAGGGDIAASNLTITEARGVMGTFASPWASDVSQVVVLGANEAPIAAPDDLSGRTIHVRRSSAYFETLTALNAKLMTARKPPVRIVEADEQLEDDDLLEMVNAGLVPATVVDSHVAALWEKVFDKVQVQPVALQTGGAIAWAVRKNSPKLLEAVNAFVAANPKGTANYNMLVKKYFSNTRRVRNARSEEDLARFRETISLFQRYATRYDFPWLLIAAQAYQESGIDQSRVSSAGAVGVMQIKPSTAEGSPVFIKGVGASAERNIEAGVKYLRYIADQLEDEGAMDRVDRGLFTFASYNAGPARVGQLRRKAKVRGLDPNRWFGNVEMVAAREIGQETVQYVANIYKYYVSYTLIQREAAARRGARGR